MSNTRTITNEQVHDLVDDAECIDTSEWRHGCRKTFVAELDGDHWRFTVDIHHEEGFQLYGNTRARKVVPVQVTRTEWKDAE